MSSTVEQAAVLFQQGFNCSQAVYAAYAPSLGLSRESALKTAFGFGGGMGCDIGQLEGQQQARQAQLFATRCLLFVRDAAEIVGILIEE